ncbi:mechanosensitive ion channel family protein [Allocoleopsis franciscana]|uniref:Small-conductance mechanosensitive channel n=1 Tax=Allocoleopsis franciscana PCC 7113 TaxID=1173027 RepID=K9WDW7_9CYAN|nr:mechanosensitive ion channel domain-containing protein [Allocoleopsis franciscana]AFZ18560.1 small-conductance mechanosensitive channel [Allocoleopsis franciscana PCC 7113]
MNRFLRFPSLVTLVARIAAVAIAIGCLLWIVPVLAQSQDKEPPSAAIVLDGRRLLEVSQSGRYSAQERADDANRVLQQKVKNAEPRVPVTIDESQNLPIIKIDGAHLLTVTPEDAPPGRSAKEQAAIWAGSLEQAIKEAQEQRSFAYIRNAIVLSVGSIFFAIACSYALGWIWHRWLQPRLPTEMTNSEDTHPRLNAELGVQIILAGIRLALLAFTVLYITDLFPHTRDLSRKITQTLVGSVVSKLIPLGNTSYSVLDVFILVGLFTGVVLLAGTTKKLLRSRVLRFTGLNRAAQETVAQVATYGLIFLGTIVVLQLWGLDLSSLTIVASVVGVGIGLGLQGIAKEFISGLVLIFERPIRVGDFVNVGELMGTVERISVRSTELRTLDELSIIIPNSRFLEAEVINWTHHSPVSRLKVPVGVAYGSNLTVVRSALIDAAKEHADVLAEPTPRVFFKGFGDNSLNFELLIWISEPRQQFRIKSDIYFRIEAILRHRNVEIPFPQRDLHVRSGSLPLEVPPQLAESFALLSHNLAKWLEYQSTIGSQDHRNRNGTPDTEQFRNRQ